MEAKNTHQGGGVTLFNVLVLYGSKSWVLTGDLMKQLWSFHTTRRCCRGDERSNFGAFIIGDAAED
jgi:hypothetical protein